MRRSIIVAVVLGLILMGSVPVYAEQPRHFDPAELPLVNPEPDQLFLLYRLIFNKTASEEFADAAKWLDWAAKVNALPQTKPVLDGYVSSLRLEVGEVNATKVSIEVVLGYLDAFDEEGMLVSLDVAMAKLKAANTTLNGLEADSGGMGSLLKASPDQLYGGVEEVRALLQRFLDLINSLRLKALLMRAQKGGGIGGADIDWIIHHFPGAAGNVTDAVENPLTVTNLRIWSNSSSALVGSSVRISGYLTRSDGIPMENRALLLRIGGDTIESVSSGSLGFFTWSISIPYIYKESIDVSAVYLPHGSDGGVYAPCASNILRIKLIYYVPVIEVSAPTYALPGKVFDFGGSVRYGNDPIAGLGVEVESFGILNQFVTNSSGAFEGSVMVPPEYPEGSYSLKFRTQPRLVYGPAYVEVPVRVTRLSSLLEVNAPTWVISGTKLRVTGRTVSRGSPLAFSDIVIRGASGVTDASSGPDGAFDAWIDVPNTLTTSSYTYSVSANPREAWIRVAQGGSRVFVVNVFTLLGGPLLLVLAVYYASRRLRIRPSQPQVIPSVGVPVMQSPSVAVEGEPQGLGSIFTSIVASIGSVYEVVFKPSKTVREWLNEAKPKVGASIFDALQSLGLLYERWLYGRPGEPDLSLATQLYHSIKGLIGNEGKGSSS